jgi:hypothetical protein
VVRLAWLDTSKRDSLFLAVAVLLSLVLYVGGLGFNSDDWSFLGKLSTSPEPHNIVSLTQSLYASAESLHPRPVQIVYLATLYALFGTNPTGYHLVNAGVLLASAVLLYLVLRELGCARGVALAIALVYAFLPNYSADRFWLAAAQAPLSVGLYLLSLLADLRLVRGRHVWAWKSLSVVALLLSGLAYELLIPFFPLSFLLTWWLEGRRFVRAHAWLLVPPNLAVLCGVVVYKLATTTRLAMNETYLQHIAYLLTGSVRANYLTFVAGMPYLTWWSLRGGVSLSLALVAMALAVLIGGYVYLSLVHDELPGTGRAFWLRLIAAGVLVSFWGYAIFVNNDNVVFSTTNVDTRTAIVATAGVAMFLIGCLGWISRRVRGGKTVFSVSVAALCVYGFLVINRLAIFWEAAYQQDLSTLSEIRAQLPTLPENTTLILDGTCPEIGPAFVFRFNWDVTGALAMLYHDPTLKGTVATPDRQIASSGLLIRTFRNWDAYAYGPNLLVYNTRLDEVYPLTSAESARAYFDSVASDPTCPPAFSWLR